MRVLATQSRPVHTGQMTPCMFIFVTLFVRGIMKVMGIGLSVSMLFHQILNETPAISRENACLIFFYEKLCYITIHVLLLLRHEARGGGEMYYYYESLTHTKYTKNQYDI